MHELLTVTMENLRKNHMEPYYVQSKDEVVPLIRDLMSKGDVVAVGGSVTLTETGVLGLLRSGDYRFLDRYAEGLSREEIVEIFRQSISADVYITSSNAITADGELYNVDGNANRVAALAFGPKQVIVVAGVNKIVPNLESAVKRVKTIAAPLNAKRLGKATPCAACGHCIAVDGKMTDGCDSAGRICATYTVTGKQINKERIKVILVDESLGY